jgi:L-ectoine synthase
MIVRTLSKVEDVKWGNGLSRRFLTEADGLGYSITDTVVYAGTSSPIQYGNHLESCYCISGRGAVELANGERFEITEGTMYALEKHDAHYLIAEDVDLRLVCVFSPALNGDETHVLTEDGFSCY